MRKPTLLALLLAATGCVADAGDDCHDTLYAYSCFGADVYVTACAKCDPVPNTPGVTLKAQCALRWANMSCVATIDGHRWAGSSTRLDCTVDGGTGQAVRYNFDLGSSPPAAYMTTVNGGSMAGMVTGQCTDISSE